MNVEEMVKKAAEGASVQQLIITPGLLSDFADNVATRTATNVIADLEIDKKPISEKEACEMYGKTRQTFSSYRKKGKIRYHRMGREIYYIQSELLEDLANF